MDRILFWRLKFLLIVSDENKNFNHAGFHSFVFYLNLAHGTISRLTPIRV